MPTSLIQRITALGNTHNLPPDWLTTRPHLFSTTTVDLASTQAATIQNAVRTIEHITTLTAFQAAAFSGTKAHTQYNPGVLFGYDFHLTPDGPKLIEINTNAAGAFIVALLEEAHHIPNAMERWCQRFIAMFLAEWRSVYPHQPLKSVAIVDHDPQNQYFYPEFLLFQHLLQKHNIHCDIVDPAAFSLRENKLWANNKPIDLVYNRLTDFDLSQPEHAVLQEAYINNQALFTPHPYAHALYAHKRNLTLLSDVTFLINCGVDEKTAAQLQQIMLPAHIIDPQNADTLWDTRKQYFFKPVSGYAGKGVYRGYNITRRVLADILAGDYMAQTLAPPSEIEIDGEKRKVDLRAYVYSGEVLGFGARLYQGQTTNLRTPGGGFAMVKIVTPS